MAEPGTTGTVLMWGGGAVVASLIPGGDINVLIGAFAGAVFTFLTSGEASISKRVGFAFVAMIIGIYGAVPVAHLITVKTPEYIEAEPPLGAVVAAGLGVLVLAGAYTAIKKLSKQSGGLLNFLMSLRPPKGGGDER